MLGDLYHNNYQLQHKQPVYLWNSTFLFQFKNVILTTFGIMAGASSVLRPQVLICHSNSDVRRPVWIGNTFGGVEFIAASIW
jgi:hypothetical protein